MTRRTHRALAAAVIAAGVLFAALGPASGAAAEDGNWWYSAYHVADARNAGWTGKGIKIAVIDEQIDPNLPVFSGTHLTVNPDPLCTNSDASVTSADPTTDNSTHGSGVAALIIGNGTGDGAVNGIAPDADVTFYGYGALEAAACDEPKQIPYGIALTRAVNSGAKIVTTSVAPGEPADDATVREIALAEAKGVILLSSQPNDSSQDITPGIGIYNGVVAANAIDSTGHLQGGSDPDVQPNTTVVAAGVHISVPTRSNATATGSSAAAPLIAGMLADVWQKYPAATGNQLLQSLIHNAIPATGQGYGYGNASLTNMLKVDPSTYPDVNPLMNKASGIPTQAQVDAAGKPTPTVPPTAHTARGAKPAPALSLMPVLVAGSVVVLVVLLAALALVLVLLARKRHVQGDTR